MGFTSDLGCYRSKWVGRSNIWFALAQGSCACGVLTCVVFATSANTFIQSIRQSWLLIHVYLRHLLSMCMTGERVHLLLWSVRYIWTCTVLCKLFLHCNRHHCMMWTLVQNHTVIYYMGVSLLIAQAHGATPHATWVAGPTQWEQ